MSSYDITDDIPALHRRDENTVKLAKMVEKMYGEYCESMIIAPEVLMDVSKIPAKFLPLLLADFGFELGPLQLSEDRQRKLISLIPFIYRQKGTLEGIVSLIRLLLKIEVTANIQTVSDLGAWEIGVGEIGFNAFIGIEDPASYLVLETEQELTETDVINILYVANLMRVAGTKIILNYPNKPTPEQELFFIGFGQIGVHEVGDEFQRLYGRDYPESGTRRELFVD